MIDRIKMLFANDIYSLYLKGIPLQKAIQQVRYIMNHTEVQRARLDLTKLAKAHYTDANDYARVRENKRKHKEKQKEHSKSKDYD
jgi:hypothetical protein